LAIYKYFSSLRIAATFILISAGSENLGISLKKVGTNYIAFSYNVSYSFLKDSNFFMAWAYSVSNLNFCNLLYSYLALVS
jgi:hypothetical protein